MRHQINTSELSKNKSPNKNAYNNYFTNQLKTTIYKKKMYSIETMNILETLNFPETTNSLETTKVLVLRNQVTPMKIPCQIFCK